MSARRLDASSGALTRATLDALSRDFAGRDANRIAQNALTRGNLREVAISRRVTGKVDWTFSHQLETGEVTDQKQASTCWMYAGLNWLRSFARRNLKLKSFEFSENFVYFHDKLE